MSLEKDVIGADHEFHDEEFVLGWAERFVPTPERLELFNIILSELQSLIPEDGRVVELGIGPGYLANHILAAMPAIKYCGIDFSDPMLEIASSRLKPYSSRITYAKADLVQDDWENTVAKPINAIVSTWALHDLGSQTNINIVYEKSAKALGAQGVLLNGDFIKPDGAVHEYEAGRFQIAKHLEMLRNAGFRDAECLVLLEEEIESPTPAQNYACIKAVK
ncbi:MAG: class I SAM-dependent methyltransferase [Gammaproteobacteria bacterium]|nr:MAG: class I SAM-dependent methyltransferase [Gammaproteobacteria bacterium]